MHLPNKFTHVYCWRHNFRAEGYSALEKTDNARLLAFGCVFSDNFNRFPVSQITVEHKSKTHENDEDEESYHLLSIYFYSDVHHLIFRRANILNLFRLAKGQ